MSRGGNLAKNTLVLSFGSAAPKLVGIITIPIVTGCLSKADYGTYDLVVSLVTLLLPLATLQMQAAAFRFLITARGDCEKQISIITNIIIFSAVVSLFVLTALYVLMGSLSPVTRLLICGYYFFDIMVATLRQVARGLSKNGLYSASVVANAAVEGLGIIGFVLLLNCGLHGALAASMVGQIVSFAILGLCLHLHKFLRIKSLSMGEVKRMLGYSWPLIPNSLSSWVISMSDKLVLTIMMGIEASAVYAVAQKIPNILSVVQSAFNLAWQESASLSSKDDDRDAYYSRAFDQVFRIAAGGTALLIAASPVLFAILIQGDYRESYIHMNILFLGSFAACMSSFLGGIYIAHMKTKEIGATTAVVAIVNLILKIVLIPSFGLFAASGSYAFCYAVLAIFRAKDMQRFQKIRFDLKKIILFCLVVLALVAVGTTQIFVVSVLNAVLGILFVLVINKNLVRFVVRRLIGKKGTE